VVIYSNGLKYEGNWERGKKEGQGNTTSLDGYMYVGEFMRYLKGVLTYPDGEVYGGEF